MERQPLPAPPLWASAAAKAVRLTAWVHGDVQGVGFRWWTRSRGLELGLRGTATNLPDGRVEVVACGSDDSALARLEEFLRTGPAYARVSRVDRREDAPAAVPRTSFDIL